MEISLNGSLRRLALALAFGASALGAGAAEFPTKGIRIVVTSAAGAALDTTTRRAAELMSQNLGQPVVVENVVGAGGLIGIRQVLKNSPADGYTLVTASNTMALAPSFSKEPGYDPAKDFIGVGDMVTAPYLLVGPVSQPARTLADLIAAAKAKPNEIMVANGGKGTSTHLPVLMFAQQAGIQVTNVPYRGNAGAYADLIGGRLNALFDAGATSGPMIADGKLRAFGVSSAKRMAAFPNIPTLAEQGLPNFDFKSYLGMFAPAGTPPVVVKRLHDALRLATSSEAMREMFRKGGAEPGIMTPEQFTEFVRQDAARAAKLTVELGVEKD